MEAPRTIPQAEIAVIGGGIVGLATALALLESGWESVVVLEAEDRVATHQTGRNSGVIHSGVYYKPGSLKARLCAEGRGLLEDFCTAHGVPFERCGKLIVATRPEQLPALDELERRGRANGLAGIRRLGADELRDVEPCAAGQAALHVPETGIVGYGDVARAVAAEIARLGGRISTGAALIGVRREGPIHRLQTAAGEVTARYLINCAGLHSDRIARLCGADPAVRIVPFRGEYYTLRPGRAGLVRNLIYPVPDPRFPFLGVHFTRRIDGAVEAGPNAVLALARHGYTWSAASGRDLAELARFPGFWRMGWRNRSTALKEVRRSLSRARFARDLRELVPEIGEDDLVPARAGVRAQAVDRQGKLLDDFALLEHDRALHVLNAPSPAATASLAIGRDLAARAARLFARPAATLTAP